MALVKLTTEIHFSTNKLLVT